MKLSVQGVSGMPDILPDESRRWHRLESAVRAAMQACGYQEIRTPILESEELFVQSVGADTDVVAKEMYRCQAGKDDSQRTYCMRPEGTAAVVRALAQAGLLRGGRPRVWYMGPMFRHERQQAGRQRQFHQFGCEFLNHAAPAADVEVIGLCADIFGRLGIAADVELLVNNLGRPEERRAYRDALREHLAARRGELAPIDQERLARSPLRVLDSKEAESAAAIAAAPRLEKFLTPDSQEYFARVLAGLDALGIAHRVDPLLVRGLDYYNLTVFEWIDPAAAGRQNSLVGGGRYDGLLARISDSDCAGTGMAAGMERILQRLADAEEWTQDVYLGLLDGEYDEARLLRLAAAWRAAGLRVQTHLQKDKIGGFLKLASSSKARYAAFVGARERAAGAIAVKPLRDGSEQFSLAADAAPAEAARQLGEQR
ncbi:MAG: histidine--tRNA ligase [Betaproteobacteria bacterium AqS2]|uniref:Histidine--tRNA ligase n=1 Tax=Candidatus Amphirhobacter heronislandensis TaxID=1732024 RepID=A0A930UC01_9GAMM|nr:histidine--tRNA ligase [Betaproteobacteria bacterium AqS2]